MFEILDLQVTGVPVAGIPAFSGKTEPCSACEAYRPAPRLDGSLVVDPEIHRMSGK